MFKVKLPNKRLMATLALSSCLLGGLPVLTWAGGNPGFTIFGGLDRKEVLNYKLQFGGHPNERDRYKLYIPSKKLTQGAKKFFVTYPDSFNGQFRTDRVDVRVDGRSLPIKEVYLDKESRFIEIEMEEAVEPNSRVVLVFSQVTNPDTGMYYLNGDVQISGDIPLRLRVGTWVVSINR